MREPEGVLSTIVLSYAEQLPRSEMAEVEAELRLIAPDLAVVPRAPSLYNALEWALPAALAIWIIKPYTDAFLAKLGTDSASGLQAALASTYRRLRKRRLRYRNQDELEACIRERQAAAKEHREPDQELLGSIGKPVPGMSIMLEFEAGGRAEFVLSGDLGDDALADALYKLPAAIELAVTTTHRVIAMKEQIDELARTRPAAASALRAELCMVVHAGEDCVYLADRSAWVDGTEILQQIRLRLEAERGPRSTE